MGSKVINTYICYSTFYKQCKIYECADCSWYVEYKSDNLEMVIGNIDISEAQEIIKQNG